MALGGVFESAPDTTELSQASQTQYVVGRGVDLTGATSGGTIWYKRFTGTFWEDNWNPIGQP